MGGEYVGTKTNTEGLTSLPKRSNNHIQLVCFDVWEDCVYFKVYMCVCCSYQSA